MVRFLQPEWLWLLPVLPFALLWRGRRANAASIEFSAVNLARSIAGRVRGRAGAWVQLLPLLAGAMLILGLARPQLGHGRTETTANGIDILLALDVSGSMEALDFKMGGQRLGRLAVVKSVVSKFISERPNDRIGLIAFAGAPYLVSTLTLDHDWLLQNLDRVHTGSVEDGTAIGSAIAAGVNRLRATPARSKVMILLTDGVNNAGKLSPQAAAEAARTLGVKIYTIAVGVRGEAPVPATDQFGQTRLVMAKVDVDEKALQAIASETGGDFYRATDTDSLRQIYEQINRLEKSAQTLQRFESYQELYAWALIPALLVMGASVGLEHGRYRRLP